MPHQCLNCGSLFQDGSPELLKGCPQCNGNRFFYTKHPLDEQQREAIKKEVGKDINEQLIDLLGKHQPDIIDQSGKWITMKPKDVRKALAQHLPNKNIKTDIKIKSNSNKSTDLYDKQYRLERLQELKRNTSYSDEPETISIDPPGKYSIDVKGLLENQPIIIHKDGSYTIHLPSAFKINQKKKQ
jgi:predicted  nucleic acid-binding Zn-ribbon protein